MPVEVAAHPDALLHHKEGVGIDLVERHLQRHHLILAQAHAQHMDLLVGVAALALPEGEAALQLFGDGPAQLLGVLLGEDQHLHGDVLLMHPVQEQRGEHHINRGVDGGVQIEQHGAQGVQYGVEGDGEPSHGEAGALFAQVQAQHIQSAGGAAAGEDQSAGEAAQNTAHQAGGQLVGNDGGGGRRDHRQRQRVDDGGDAHEQHKVPAHGAPCQPEQRDIHQQVQDTRQVKGRLQPQLGLQQRAGHLAEAVQAAAVKPLRHDKQVHGHRQQNGAEHAHDQPQPFVLLHLLQHTKTPPYLFKLTASCTCGTLVSENSAPATVSCGIATGLSEAVPEFSFYVNIVIFPRKRGNYNISPWACQG